MKTNATSDLDAVLAKVKDGSRTWVRVSLDDRIKLAEQMMQGYLKVAEASVEAACKAKGFDLHSQLAGEEWLLGPLVTVRNLRLVIEALRDIKKYGAPRIEPSWISTLPDGRLSIKVYPSNKMDAALLAKHEGVVHMQPSVTRENLKDHQASFYRKPHDGRVCAILGAGNVNAIPPTDAIYKLFVEGTVCVVKMNPVNAYIGPFMEQAFKAAIDKGYFAVVYGGAEEGGYLVNHPAVDEVHITGSDKTHDFLVWGPPGPEREERKKTNQPLLKKTITSELGNISPIIVVPGPYDDGELAYQGRNIAGMVSLNASFNCVAAKLLVTHEGWNKRQPFIDGIASSLAQTPTRKAYYPGAEERWKQFTDGRPNLKLVGNAKAGELPFAIIPGVDPTKGDDRVFHHEPWCTVLSETALPASNTETFLQGAVSFLNGKVWGSLCATLIVHPKTYAEHRDAIETAIRELRYGTVTVNTWPGAVYGIINTPWGAHPSSNLKDIQSGIGWVHNSFMLEEIEKSVLRAPVKGFPVAPWVPGHKSLAALGKKLVDFEAAPSWLKIPGIAATALRG